MSKKRLNYVLTFLPIAAIRLYQLVLSPEQSFWGKKIGWKICRFHPTCSEYSVQALEKYGLLKGGYISSRRILRCHPWNPGGYDPIP